MMCYAVVKKFAQALGDAAEPDLPASDATVIDETTDIGKRQAAAKQRNSIAMACLTMAFTTDAAMSVVFKAKTTEWPGGLAWMVMDMMRKKYSPQDLVTRAELRNKLNNLSMADGDDPKVLFEEISTIENRYNIGTNRVDEADLIALVMQKAPKMYKSVIAAQELRLGNRLTLTDLESAMDKLYRVMDNDVEGSGNELQLNAFTGKCYKCGKAGHMRKDCYNNASDNGNGKFNGKCFNCGKIGHRSADCWQKEENRHKRPEGYSTGETNNETGQAAVDNGRRVEFLLCGMSKEDVKTFPDSKALINDPNIWIGDTGATTHMKKSDSGMTNIRSATKSDAVTMGNKQVEATTKVGDVYGTICDKNGNEVNRVGLTNVSHVPGAGYNMFSLSRMIGKEGWKLVGDKNAIVIEKNGHQVKFDILISTPKGVAYAMYFKEDAEVTRTMHDEEKRPSGADQIQVNESRNEQSDKEACDENRKSAPVVLMTMVCLLFIIAMMARWSTSNDMNIRNEKGAIDPMIEIDIPKTKKSERIKVGEGNGEVGNDTKIATMMNETKMIQSRQTDNPPQECIEEMDNITAECKISLTQVEIGTRVGSKVKNTEELHVMKHDKVMKDFNKERWKKAMKEEYEHMVMSEPIPHKDAG
jgi:hypothetical protein